MADELTPVERRIAAEAVAELVQETLALTAEHALHHVLREQSPNIELPPPTSPEEVAQRWREKWLCP